MSQELSSALAAIDALKRHGMSAATFGSDAEEVEHEDTMLELHAKACAFAHEADARAAKLAGLLRECLDARQGIAGYQARLPVIGSALAERIKAALGEGGGM